MSQRQGRGLGGWWIGVWALALLLGPAPREFAAEFAATAPAPETEQASEDAGVKLVAWLELAEPLRDGPVPFAWVSPQEAGPSLRGVLAQLETVARSDEHLGLVVYLDQPMLSLTQAQAIADAMHRVRASGKRVIAFAEAYGLLGYYVASAADTVVLQHKGMVEITGLSVEEVYLAGMLEKIGLHADLMQVGEYKGASEALTRRGPSPQWDENFDNLLDDLYDQIITAIAQGRRMTVPEFEAALRDAWTLDDKALVKRGLVDALADRDLTAVTEVAFDQGFAWDELLGDGDGGRARASNPFALFQMLFQEPTTRTRRDTIAIISAYGAIHSGESTRGDGLFGSDSIGSRTVVEAIGDAAQDPNVKGVVIRIDSPGGSALASEVIWQAVRDLGQSKPVFASVGPMAASGGYYIACGADEVYVAPQSILGSIGVVGGKLTMSGLYEWAGIDITRRGRGPWSDMFNSVEPFTDEQRAAVRSMMQRVYDQFTDRVVIGRGARLGSIEKVAKGRLFTGRQAIDNGLADRLGGVDDALADLAEQLGLDEGAYDVVHLPAPMSLQQFLNEAFGVRAPGAARAPGLTASAQGRAALEAARRVLGAAAWRSVSRQLSGLMLLRQEPVVALLPAAIVVQPR